MLFTKDRHVHQAGLNKVWSAARDYSIIAFDYQRGGQAAESSVCLPETGVLYR